MTRLVIIVEIDEDPVLTDPHEVAETVIRDAVEQGERYTDSPSVEFVSAEWA